MTSPQERASDVDTFAQVADRYTDRSAPTDLDVRRRLSTHTHVHLVEPVTVPTTATPEGYYGRHRRPEVGFAPGGTP